MSLTSTETNVHTKKGFNIYIIHVNIYILDIYIILQLLSNHWMSMIPVTTCPNRSPCVTCITTCFNFSVICFEFTFAQSMAYSAPMWNCFLPKIILDTSRNRSCKLALTKRFRSRNVLIQFIIYDASMSSIRPPLFLFER